MGGKKIFLEVILVISILVITFFVFYRLYQKIRLFVLNKYLKKISISSIDVLSGCEFEEFLYFLFLTIGFKVTKTKKSYDYGADLILQYGNKKIVLQCKLYTNHLVGSSAVQEVYSAVKYYDANMGAVITNSRFTSSSINLANKSSILLWDRETLQKLLSLSSQEKRLFKNTLLNSCN